MPTLDAATEARDDEARDDEARDDEARDDEARDDPIRRLQRHTAQRRDDVAYYRRTQAFRHPALDGAPPYDRSPHVRCVAESPLDAGFDPLGVDLATALERRRSVQTFFSNTIDRGTLERLVVLAQGVTGAIDLPADAAMDRLPLGAAPAAGALTATRLYVAPVAVEGLERGLHLVAPLRRRLERLDGDDPVPGLAQATMRPDLEEHCAAILPLTVLPARSCAKYGPRGDRFALLEAGHVAQNVLLAATALGLGTLPLGGFFDDEVADHLGLDEDEMCVYLLVVGAPES